MNTQDKSVSNVSATPWFVDEDRTHYLVSSQGSVIAVVQNDLPQREANAYLLASAPALRDALMDCVAAATAWIAEDPLNRGPSRAVVKARAALAKALPPVSEGGEGDSV